MLFTSFPEALTRKKILHPHCEESRTQNLINASVDILEHGLDYIKRIQKGTL